MLAAFRSPVLCRPCTLRRVSAAALAIGLLVTSAAGHAHGVDYAELAEIFGEPVTTSVTGKPQRASEAPASLTIITREDIRRSPAHDVPGLVSMYAGIDVARWTQGQTDVAIRGGLQPYNPRLLVLVNGRQVYLDHYGMTNWSGIGVQLDEIQQIEIVRGPNSALFGFNAVSGVINIITVNPLQEELASAKVGLGENGQRFASAIAAFKVHKAIGLRLSAGYEVANEFRSLSTSPIAPAPLPVDLDPRHKEAAAELYAKVSDRTDFSGGITHSASRMVEIPPLPATVPTAYRFTALTGRIAHDTGWGMLSARILRNTSHFAVDYEQDLDFSNRVLVASAEALVRASAAHTLRASLDYRSNTLVARPGYPGATRYKVMAASGMWEGRFGDSLTITAAARLDHLKLSQEGPLDQPTIFTQSDFDRSITDWSFNGAMLLKLDDVSNARVAASRGLEAPSLSSFGTRLNYSFPGLPTTVIAGNPYVRPATIWSAEVGYSRDLPAIGGKIDLAAFYNRTNDILSLSGPQSTPLAAPPLYPFVLFSTANVGSFQAYGLELSASGTLQGPWQWMFNYSWTKVDQAVPENALAITRPVSFDTTTPAHKVKAQVSYEKGPWLASVAARYTSGSRQLVMAPPVPFGPLGLVAINDSLAIDAKVAFKLSDRLTFALSGENLTGANGAYLSPAAAQRRLRAFMTVSF